jgi:diketogulonate reductase-like aldo/keto reductase
MRNVPISIPSILYGTAWKKERTADLVALAIRCGFRGVDTACQPKHYNEAGVGAGISAVCLKDGLRRTDLFLQTKYTPLDGQDPHRVPYDPRAALAEQVRQSHQASLRNLQTDYIDCLVLHSPLARRSETREVWRAMEVLVDEGGVHRIGLSNCYSLAQFRLLFDAVRIKPSVLQNRFHAKTGYDRELRAFCRACGVAYQSFWTLTANRHVLAHPVMMALAARHQRTPAQILFRYLTQEGVTPLTGTTAEEHMREDLAVLEFELTKEEQHSVEMLLQ